MVDSALAHFFTKQLYKPMNLEIRIVPEIQNRRNVTLVIGDTESIEIEKNKVIVFAFLFPVSFQVSRFGENWKGIDRT